MVGGSVRGLASVARRINYSLFSLSLRELLIQVIDDGAGGRWDARAWLGLGLGLGSGSGSGLGLGLG